MHTVSLVSQYSVLAVGWTTEELWFNSWWGARGFSSPKHLYQLWDQLSPFFSWYWGPLPEDNAAKVWNWLLTRM